MAVAEDRRIPPTGVWVSILRHLKRVNNRLSLFVELGPRLGLAFSRRAWRSAWAWTHSKVGRGDAWPLVAGRASRGADLLEHALWGQRNQAFLFPYFCAFGNKVPNNSFSINLRADQHTECQRASYSCLRARLPDHRPKGIGKWLSTSS